MVLLCSWLLKYNKPFVSFLQVTSLTVSCPDNFGKPILIKLDKQHLIPIPFDSWFPAKVEVKSPEGETYIFPIYRWITDKDEHIFREGTGLWK